ncbi:keratin, type I cytoskeletal 9-like [Argiope bruennichi]|uniref:keratin, type I cytoskeletal 9-like n=1 Tax=Argiope bruennichi TaxID=94029 RepID=UPI00249541B3|nr:keratin, type I cytoskeletal 9-like [Argiope bruennichi]
MDSLLLWTLTISLMFAGGQCYSESTSCSTVNGKTICESQKGAGNVAGSSSSAYTGRGGSYQDANAMTGNTYTGQSSSSRSAAGNAAPPGFVPNFGGFPFSFGGPTFGGSSSSSVYPSTSETGNMGTGSTFVTSTSGSDFTGTGGGFAGSAAGEFPGTAAGGFAGAAAGGFAGSGGSGVFVGGGFPFSFGGATFDGSSGSPAGPSASDTGNTGSGSTFATSASGSDFSGDGGAFAGSAVGGFPGIANGGFAGAAAGGFAFSDNSGVFVGGPPQNVFGPGFPFSFVFGRRR